MTRFYYEGKWYDINEVLRKADLWDQYGIYDNDSKEEILIKDLIKAYLALEAVQEFILGRREDIEKDIEDLGMLLPVLEYFLEAEG